MPSTIFVVRVGPLGGNLWAETSLGGALASTSMKMRGTQSQVQGAPEFNAAVTKASAKPKQRKWGGGKGVALSSTQSPMN